jgi:hypothetical protein
MVGPDERTVGVDLTLPRGDEIQMYHHTYTRKG